MTLIADILQSAGPGSGGQMIESVRTSDNAEGVIVWRVHDNEATGLLRKPLTLDDEEISAAVTVNIGDPWPIGLADGKSLPGARCIQKRVVRRSNVHAWVITRFGINRWGAAAYQTMDYSNEVDRLEIPRRVKLFEGPGVSVWARPDPAYWNRPVTVLNVRIPISSLTGAEAELIESNIGKRYQISSVTHFGALVMPGPDGSVPRIFTGWRSLVTPAFGRGVLTYQFKTPGTVPGDNHSNIWVPPLGLCEQWRVTEATPPVPTALPPTPWVGPLLFNSPPKIEVVAASEIPGGSVLPYFSAHG